MSPLIREYAGYVPFSPVDYVWIDFASAPMPTPMQSDVITEKLRALPYTYDTPNRDWPLPFEDICVLLPFVAERKTGERVGVLVATLRRRGDELLFQMWSNHDAGQNASVSLRSVGTLNSDCRMTVSPYYAKAAKLTEEECREQGLDFFRVAYRRIMSMVLLGLGEEVVVSRATAPNTFINAKRIRKGKRPFFEWTTVEVKPRAAVSESAGGTHASPKPHLRRGHVRRYKSGKVVAIKSMIVNKHKMPEEGFIFHDYVVENPVVH